MKILISGEVDAEIRAEDVELVCDENFKKLLAPTRMTLECTATAKINFEEMKRHADSSFVGFLKSRQFSSCDREIMRAIKNSLDAGQDLAFKELCQRVRCSSEVVAQRVKYLAEVGVIGYLS